MNIYEDTNPRELKELLRQIHAGDTVLPDFQRNFVWDPNMTMELIISIAENYPAGSLLRIRNTQNLFAFREFEGAPKLNGRLPTFLILDGQQRLTSLYQAFLGVGEYRYYLNLKALLGKKDFEDCIFHLRANHPRVSNLNMLEFQAKDLILPLEILRDGSGNYSKWVRDISRLQGNDQDRIALEDQLYELDNWVQAIDDYKFPVVTLTDSTSAEAVCTIFETLNRTGVKLSPFELLTARFWHQNINLRNLWAEAVDAYPVIADFSVDPYYALQIVSMISKEKPIIKRSEVMDLEKEVVEKYWENAIDGLQRALTFLQQECGVLTPGLLPYVTIIVPLASMFTKIMVLKGPQIGAAKDKISRWFWCAVFGQRYESSPTSQSALDYTEMVRWLNGGQEPETVARFQFLPETLRETTGRQRAIYRGVLSLVLRNRSRDFHNHDVLNLEVIYQHHVDDHHIFPNKFLERNGVDSRLRDSILNHTLIDRDTNIRIKDRAPSKYMQEILKERGEVRFTELLHSHLLPTGKKSPFWTDDYEAFLEWRQTKIWEEIVKVTGLA